MGFGISSIYALGFGSVAAYALFAALNGEIYSPQLMITVAIVAGIILVGEVVINRDGPVSSSSNTIEI